jgi:uncharacterized phage-associated protein
MEAKTSSTLPRWPFTLDTDKAVESVLYIIPRISEQTLHCVAKVLYHADKLHLSRYGRPISGDWYSAMEYGPVPSTTYSILKTRRGDEHHSIPERAMALNVVGRNASATRPADLNVLSESERECLDESAKQIGHKTFDKRTKDSHGPAWKAAELNGMIRLEHMLLEIENAEELRSFFAPEST